jgi:DNA-3-methyladenine glycosylase
VSSFYARDVGTVARALIGCVVRHGEAAGMIVETEAYHEVEPACHAYVGLTARTSTLFGPPGRAYVYLSYGLHTMLNAVCEPEGVGAAVLVRALEPVDGIELMHERRGRERLEELCSGPGKLTEALGIGLAHNGGDLRSGPVTISERRRRELPIEVSRRIGITRAVELEWRFAVPGSHFVSRGRSAASPGRRTGSQAGAAAGWQDGAGEATRAAAAESRIGAATPPGSRDAGAGSQDAARR